MRAVVWHGKRDVRVDEVPDPVIQDPGDAIIRVTSTNICGSDLHLYEVLGAFMNEGDVLGHEPMGIVEEVGADVTAIAPGDRVVIPFQICCGTAGCASTACRASARRPRCASRASGAALFGYSELYGSVPGGQAEFLRVPQAQYTHVKVPARAARRPLRLPLRRAADRLAGGRVRRPRAGGHPPRARPRADRRHGLPHRPAPRGPPGHRRRPRRRAARPGPRPWRHDRSTCATVDDLGDAVRDLTAGRGADAVIDAVGMEAHGSPRGRGRATSWSRPLPDAVAKKLMTTVGIDRLAALHSAIDAVRRGGTISLIGVYGGMADPMPMMTLFDKQMQLRMGQANVKRWVPDILPLLTDDDPLGRRRLRHPPAAARGGSRRLRRLPGQEGRHGQGRAQARPGRRGRGMTGPHPARPSVWWGRRVPGPVLEARTPGAGTTRHREPGRPGVAPRPPPHAGRGRADAGHRDVCRDPLDQPRSLPTTPHEDRAPPACTRSG